MTNLNLCLSSFFSNPDFFPQFKPVSEAQWKEDQDVPRRGQERLYFGNTEAVAQTLLDRQRTSGSSLLDALRIIKGRQLPLTQQLEQLGETLPTVVEAVKELSKLSPPTNSAADPLQQLEARVEGLLEKSKAVKDVAALRSLQQEEDECISKLAQCMGSITGANANESGEKSIA